MVLWSGIVTVVLVTPANIAGNETVTTIALIVWSLPFVPLGQALIQARTYRFALLAIHLREPINSGVRSYRHIPRTTRHSGRLPAARHPCVARVVTGAGRRRQMMTSASAGAQYRDQYAATYSVTL
jgi:hypothetical protein